VRTRLLRVGSPHALRAELSGARVLIDLETVQESDLAALRALGVASATAIGNRVEIDPGSRGIATADLVAALVAAGARVTAVAPATPESLEDAYLTILAEPG
jgi:hypothetical protein